MGTVDGKKLCQPCHLNNLPPQFLRSSLGALYSQSSLPLPMKECPLQKGMLFRMLFLISRNVINKLSLSSFYWWTNQFFIRSSTAKLSRKYGTNSLSYINELLCNHCISCKKTITTCGLVTMVIWPHSLTILRCSTSRLKNLAQGLLRGNGHLQNVKQSANNLWHFSDYVENSGSRATHFVSLADMAPWWRASNATLKMLTATLQRSIPEVHELPVTQGDIALIFPPVGAWVELLQMAS